MRSRLLTICLLLFAVLLSGCGSSSTGNRAAGGSATSTSQSSGAATTSSSSTGTNATACPTSNTRSFAKARFAADVGGSLALMHRYVLKPYEAGAFRSGAAGRKKAILKAGLAIATTTKLLKNAQQNAQSNPTLCKSISTPLSQLGATLGSLGTEVKSGSLPGAALGQLSGLLNAVKSKSSQAGIPIAEQPVPLGS